MRDDCSEPATSGVTPLKHSLSIWENEGGAGPNGLSASARGNGPGPGHGIDPVLDIDRRRADKKT